MSKLPQTEAARFLMPTREPEDWASGLADRSQWAAGKSAYELAHAWERAGGQLPARVGRCLGSSSHTALHDITPLIGLPEHRVDLGDGRRASQTDLLLLGRSRNGELVVLGVEGKESESFGRYRVADWLKVTKTGRERLSLVCDTIGLTTDAVNDVYYQLLQRAAAAVIEARRFGARHAVLLVHSFSPKQAHLNAYKAFVALYHQSAGVGEVVELQEFDDVTLHAAWVSDEKMAARGPFGGLQVAEDAIAWLRKHYRAQTYYCERDVAAVLQRRMGDLISEQRLTGLRVRRNQHLRSTSASKQVDLVIEDGEGRIVVALEVKYEPSPIRPDLSRADGRRPERVTDWSEICKDFGAVRSLVDQDAVLSAVAIVVDEGGRLATDTAPADGIWEAWTELANGKPDWLKPQILRATFSAPPDRAKQEQHA